MMVINSRAWVYPILVGAFVAVIAVTLQYGEQRFAEEARGRSPDSARRRCRNSLHTAAQSPRQHAAPPQAAAAQQPHRSPTQGRRRPPQAARPAHPPTASPWDVWRTNAAHPLARLILQILVIVAAARLFGAAVRHFGQPPVIGEIAAGIALGPSLLGAWMPGVSAQLFPANSLGLLADPHSGRRDPLHVRGRPRPRLERPSATGRMRPSPSATSASCSRSCSACSSRFRSIANTRRPACRSRRSGCSWGSP